MSEKYKIYYNADGWVCERYPQDLPVEDDSKFIEVDEEEFNNSLETNSHFAWRVVKGKLVNEQFEEISAEATLENLRALREEICFPVINRGQMWHDSLTQEQKQELQDWYNEWLNVTQNKIEPCPPAWLFSTNKEVKSAITKHKNTTT